MDETMRFILMYASALVGGLFIRTAIVAYNDKKYFCFGYNIMLAIWCVINLGQTHACNLKGETK